MQGSTHTALVHAEHGCVVDVNDDDIVVDADDHDDNDVD
jgi:hypothetical protein